MWLFTKDGFYSAVAHRDDPDLLVVRARSRIDLQWLIRNHGLTAEIVDTPVGSDYPCRIIVPRGAWAEVVRTEALDITYGNFKSEVNVVIGPEREDVYHRVWAVLLAVEKEPGAVAERNTPSPKAKKKTRLGKGKKK